MNWYEIILLIIGIPVIVYVLSIVQMTAWKRTLVSGFPFLKQFKQKVKGEEYAEKRTTESQ